MTAAENGHESIVQLLLNNNADPNLIVSTLTWCSKSISVSLVLVTFVVI